LQQEVGPGARHDPRVRATFGLTHGLGELPRHAHHERRQRPCQGLSGPSAAATCSPWTENALETILPPASWCCPRQSRRLPRVIDG
jgi:hypothetical protein